MADTPIKTRHYDAPSGGWGSLKGMARVFSRELPDPAILETLARQNKPEGYMCSSYAWGKPAHPHNFEFCENGANPVTRTLGSCHCVEKALPC